MRLQYRVESQGLRFGAVFSMACVLGTAVALAQQSPSSQSPDSAQTAQQQTTTEQQTTPTEQQTTDPSAQAPEGPASPVSNDGWRRFDDAQSPPVPRSGPRSRVADPGPIPEQIILPAGSWITVHVNEMLSSDRNQVGQIFTGTLAQPLVADGYVIARRGQTVTGRISEVQKAGRVKGTSRLAIEITEVGLVDGRQMPLVTQLMEHNAGTSKGTDAAAIGTTTGVGAAIGAAANGGAGAGIGAAAGAAASTLGVLLTRGRATVVYPETTLTFRVLQPLTVATNRAPDAFQIVAQQDYDSNPGRRAPALQGRQGRWGYPGIGVGYPWPYFAPWGYGPSFMYFSGPRYRGFGRRGWYR